MKIAIVVQGRFHAFDLAKALLRRGHDVTVFTNYPVWAAARFGLPPERVRSFWVHGLASRIGDRVCEVTNVRFERWLNPAFGRWAVRELARDRWDVIHGWSGVSEEILEITGNQASLNLLMRGSTHIRAQATILSEEQARVGTRIDCPDQWIIDREEREYRLADRIVVLSNFARESFLSEGVAPAKVGLLISGADSQTFHVTKEVVETRCDRILSRRPLSAIFVGTVCFRKGIWDLAAAARELKGLVTFRLVGNVLPEVKRAIPNLHQLFDVVPRQAQKTLIDWYASSDLFVFPTLEEGFPAVLGQAHACAVPIVTTPNGAGKDLVIPGETGWLIPVRDSTAIVEHLRWCDANRHAVADVVWQLYSNPRIRTWDDVAADFEDMCISEFRHLHSDVAVNG